MKGRDTKKGSLRDELIQAGLDFLGEHTMDELTMRKMAELCHVTPHAIYNYFRSKDELLGAIGDRIEKMISEYCMDALSRDSADFAVKMNRFAQAYLILFEKYPHHLQILLNQDREPYYLIESDGERLSYLSKYPGMPDLKVLNKISTLPAPILKGMLKVGQVMEHIKKTPSGPPNQRQDPLVTEGQILLLCFINGLQYGLHNGLLPEEDREAAVLSMLQLLFDRIL